MQTITTIGLDIAKSVFQVHGVDADGQVVIRRQLKRRYVLAFFQKLENRARTMQLSNPIRHHTPDDDPEPGTLGTGEDICPDCRGTGKQVDKATGKRGDLLCERCDGTGIIIEGIG